MKSDFLIAVTQLAAERNLPREVVISAIEAALVSVYKKDSIAAGQDLSVKILPNSGEVRVAVIKTVADEVEDSKLEMTPKEAQEYKKGAVVGDVVEIETTAQFAGRIAAQTAKQVVMQRLREAERELVYEEFADREGDIVSVVVQRTDPRQVTLDLDKTEAIMPTSEMVPTERYRAGQRLKVLIVEVNRSPKGPQVLVSRGHRSLVSRLFELEVPEIYNGTVEIRSIAREAGYRTKVAVAAKQEGIDPVGSCVGLRGIRIQNIVNELHGEKIDVVQWDKDSAVYIANSLSPAQVARVEVNEEEGEAMVVVSDRHLSLAIGKEGQNARLAAKLTGWRIDIKGAAEAEEERVAAAVLAAAAKEEAPTPIEEPVAAVAGVEAVAAPAEVVEIPTEAEELAPVAEIAAEEVVPEPAVAAETPAIEEAETIEVLIAAEEQAPQLQEVPVRSVIEEAPATRSIEEIFPTAPEVVVKTDSVLRFAEDLDIAIPGRSNSKSRKKKRKRGRHEVEGRMGGNRGAGPNAKPFYDRPD
jgi:N utilization substance protein A